MLLKLISLPSQPTIHFSLNLPAFPSYLDPPQSYTAQINHLLVEDLEVPNTLHSLDKSVGLMSLLEEVLFEIKDRTGDGGVQHTIAEEKFVRVTCRFVDGAVEDWVLGGLSTEGTALISALDCIIHNVQESTLEDEKEYGLYLQSQPQKNRSRGMSRLSMPPAPSPLVFTPTSKPRHKKQRSLFMQIVSSIVNLTSTSSSSSSSHLPTFVDHSNPEKFYSPPPSPTTSSPTTPPSSKRARFLRRTARSNLVNTYRRHVLPELTRRFPKDGGFGVWILHSMRRRALERMEDLIEEAARTHQHHQHQHQHQQVLELRQRHEHEEREQEQQFRYQQERARSPIRVDERPFGPRFSMEDPAGFSATTMTVPLSFSDEGGSAENENEPTNARNANNEEVEDDLETITDGSSVHTPSSTSHIGFGFMGGSSSDSPPDSSSPPFTSTTATSRPPSLSPKSLNPSNPQTILPPHFHFEYTQLSRLRQRLYSLILFADSQMRIAEDEKRNRDEIILVRGRRRAWLNGELGVGKGLCGVSAGGSATGAGNGMGHMQWGFAAPFKSSPLARYSWSAPTELDDDESMASANDTTTCLLDAQEQQVDEEDEDDFPYDEFRGPPAVRSHTLSYAYGRQSRRSSRYINGGGGGSGKRLLPVAEEIEYECDQRSTNNSNADVIDIQLYKPLGGGSDDEDDSFHHRDDSFLHYHHQEDGDMDDNFSLEDPRELDLELGFGLQDPNDSSSVEEAGQELFAAGGTGRQEHDQRERERRSGESVRIAFEMERPKIIPRVRDGDDECSMLPVSTSSSSSTSTRSGGLLSWGYWGVGKSSGEGEGGSGSGSGSGGIIRRRKSWKNGLGIGIAGLGSRGRSLNKTSQRRGEGEGEIQDKEQQQQQLRYRASTSSTSSTASSSSSTKSQQQHQREPAQVEPGEAELLHREQGQDEHHLQTTPLLCQPVSFSVSHGPAPALAAITALPQTASNGLATTPTTSSVPMPVAIPPPNDTTKDTTENPKEPTPTTTVANNNLTFVPAPLSFATKKLRMTSPAPNVYADIDVSVVHVGDDDKSLLNLGFGANHHQGINAGATSHHHTAAATRIQQQQQGGTSHHHTPRLRPRRHKREYQYQQHHHAYGNDVHFGQEDECVEYELSGYGHFEGGSGKTQHGHQHQHQHGHNSMIHARRHLDELLLEEGLFGCDPVGEQEEFTLSMDVPARGGNNRFGLGGGGGGGGGGKKALRKMQYLQLHHNNRDSNRSRLQQSLPLSSSFSPPMTNNASSSDRMAIQEFGEIQNPKGSV